jgi:hypothetical protein
MPAAVTMAGAALKMIPRASFLPAVRSLVTFSRMKGSLGMRY